MAKVGSLSDRSKGGLVLPDHRGQRRQDHGQSPGAGGSGSVAIDEVRWWGFLPGARVFACDLERAQGQGLWATSLRARPRAVLGQRHWAQLSST
jgi:hypothetical protein